MLLIAEDDADDRQFIEAALRERGSGARTPSAPPVRVIKAESRSEGTQRSADRIAARVDGLLAMARG